MSVGYESYFDQLKSLLQSDGVTVGAPVDALCGPSADGSATHFYVGLCGDTGCTGPVGPTGNIGSSGVNTPGIITMPMATSRYPPYMHCDECNARKENWYATHKNPAKKLQISYRGKSTSDILRDIHNVMGQLYQAGHALAYGSIPAVYKQYDISRIFPEYQEKYDNLIKLNEEMQAEHERKIALHMEKIEGLLPSSNSNYDLRSLLEGRLGSPNIKSVPQEWYSHYYTGNYGIYYEVGSPLDQFITSLT